MNSNKKSITVRGVPPSLKRQSGQFKPVVAQLKTDITAQNKKQPVAPPVYRPNTTTSNAAQPKMANATVNRKLPVAPPVFRPQVPKVLQPKSRQASQATHHSVAPPVYRPDAKKIVQAKATSAPAKIANSVRPITAKTSASTLRAVQMAEAKKGRKECFCAVVGKDGQKTNGAYKGGIHAEINALETYLSGGGTLADIKSIELSSMPCKYCYVILGDLGIRDKVNVESDDREFGSCSGGSYGWFYADGAVWEAIKAVTGKDDQRKYIDSVIERQRKL